VTWFACVGTGELAGSGVEFRCECWEAFGGRRLVGLVRDREGEGEVNGQRKVGGRDGYA
jgi:hypothetical protein